jgi:hypothetical protein
MYRPLVSAHEISLRHSICYSVSLRFPMCWDSNGASAYCMCTHKRMRTHTNIHLYIHVHIHAWAAQSRCMWVHACMPDWAAQGYIHTCMHTSLSNTRHPHAFPHMHICIYWYAYTHNYLLEQPKSPACECIIRLQSQQTLIQRKRTHTIPSLYVCMYIRMYVDAHIWMNVVLQMASQRPRI